MGLGLITGWIIVKKKKSVDCTTTKKIIIPTLDFFYNFGVNDYPVYISTRFIKPTLKKKFTRMIEVSGEYYEDPFYIFFKRITIINLARVCGLFFFLSATIQVVGGISWNTLYRQGISKVNTSWWTCAVAGRSCRSGVFTFGIPCIYKCWYIIPM